MLSGGAQVEVAELYTQGNQSSVWSWLPGQDSRASWLWNAKVGTGNGIEIEEMFASMSRLGKNWKLHFPPQPGQSKKQATAWIKMSFADYNVQPRTKTFWEGGYVNSYEKTEALHRFDGYHIHRNFNCPEWQRHFAHASHPWTEEVAQTHAFGTTPYLLWNEAYVHHVDKVLELFTVPPGKMVGFDTKGLTLFSKAFCTSDEKITAYFKDKAFVGWMQLDGAIGADLLGEYPDGKNHGCVGLCTRKGVEIEAFKTEGAHAEAFSCEEDKIGKKGIDAEGDMPALVDADMVARNTLLTLMVAKGDLGSNCFVRKTVVESKEGPTALYTPIDLDNEMASTDDRKLREILAIDKGGTRTTNKFICLVPPATRDRFVRRVDELQRLAGPKNAFPVTTAVRKSMSNDISLFQGVYPLNAYFPSAADVEKDGDICSWKRPADERCNDVRFQHDYRDLDRNVMLVYHALKGCQ
jgi:hypothetical protein